MLEDYITLRLRETGRLADVETAYTEALAIRRDPRTARSRRLPALCRRHAEHSCTKERCHPTTTFASEFCIGKAQSYQWYRFDANILNSARRNSCSVISNLSNA